ncbi:MAG: PAS domain-containing sensor histidine kinase, partial [Planctomycetota bacterium]
MSPAVNIFQPVGLFRLEICPTHAVLPWVGLAAEKAIGERYDRDKTVRISRRSRSFRSGNQGLFPAEESAPRDPAGGMGCAMSGGLEKLCLAVQGMPSGHLAMQSLVPLFASPAGNSRGGAYWREMNDLWLVLAGTAQSGLVGVPLCWLGLGLLLIGALTVGGLAYAIWRTRLRMARQESEQQFRCLFRNCSDAILLLDENRFFDCNDAALRIFGFKNDDELLRLHPADLSPPLQPDGSDSKRLATEKMAKALSEGNHRFEWLHRRADGTEFPAEVSLNAVRIHRRRVLQVVIRDITYRKTSEEQLRSQEEKLRTISQAALDAVIMMDGRGRAVHWNPAAERMFGYSAEEALGQEIHPLVMPDRHREPASNSLANFFQTGEGHAVGRTLELQAVRKAGDEFPVEVSLAPIHVENEWWAVAVVRDITERKLADEKLRAEQRTLRRLLKAHDHERKLIAYEIHDGLAQQLVAAIMQCQAVPEGGSQTEPGSHLLGLLRQCLAETRHLISGLRPPVLDECGVVTAVQGLLAQVNMEGGPEIEFQPQGFEERLAPVLENSIY